MGKHAWILDFFKNILWLGFIAVVVLFITKHIILNMYIPSESMENTLSPGDLVVGNRLTKEYKRGDIVAFPYEDGRVFIKRIVGLPGEEIEIKDHAVYIDGEKLEETYLKETMETEETLHFQVPEDSYFVMGDNRNDSFDARFWDNPYIKKESILAKAVFKFWPIWDAKKL